MHEDEQPTSVGLVRRLVAAQHPRWVHLPVRPVDSAGTVHALYRLGDDLVVRLPRVDGAAREQVVDRDWVPRLAPYLPLAVPEQVAVGEPDDGYPFSWSVCRWIDGSNPGPGLPLHDAAGDLGRFVAALSGIRGQDGPPADGSMAAGRGRHPRGSDEFIRRSITGAGTRIDRFAATRAWAAACSAPAYDGDPVWVHGDLLPGNLLARDGRVTAVIDWGAFGSGDPAVDLLPAWSLLDAATRPAYREIVGADDATWLRGRGWGLYVALSAIPYYWRTNPPFVALALRMLRELLAGD